MSVIRGKDYLFVTALVVGLVSLATLLTQSSQAGPPPGAPGPIIRPFVPR